MAVVIHTADIQGRHGGKLVLARIKNRFPRLRLLWADGGYAGKLIEYVYCWYFIVLQIVKRSDPLPGFKVLPRRWVVERTFAWINKYRRNSKDYERNVDSSKAMVHIAMIARMLNYLDKRDFLV